MTEVEWLASRDESTMLAWLKDRASLRKLALFACACCRRIWTFITDERYQRAVELAELIDAELAARQEWETLCTQLRAENSPNIDELTPEENRWMRSPEGLPRDVTCHEPGGNAEWAALLAANAQAAKQESGRNLVGHAASYAKLAAVMARSGRIRSRVALEFREEDWTAWKTVIDQAHTIENQAQACLVRDILGNPFRPVRVDPVWQTGTVVSLAQAIYDERAFDRLPILADALEDAGCTNADILNHCRQPGEHVRGCWVVDLLLGKG
jgi:hypothetical protein